MSSVRCLGQAPTGLILISLERGADQQLVQLRLAVLAGHRGICCNHHIHCIMLALRILWGRPGDRASPREGDQIPETALGRWPEVLFLPGYSNLPAINNHGAFGRWAFIEVADPWDAPNLIPCFIEGQK